VTQPSDVEFVVASSDAGMRLDAALAERPEIASRAAAQRLVEAGAVTVDGRKRPKSHRVVAGERIRARPPEDQPLELREPPADLELVFCDDDLLVVDKPAGVVVHPAPGHRTGTLVDALAGLATGGEKWRPGIVHRLDRDTSGLMIVARTDAAHAALQEQLRRRLVRREYLALVDGRPSARSGTIEAPIGRDRRRRTIHSTHSDRPREARTHFTVERELPRTTLLRVRLETGRTHQIRVHLAAIGHPVCGDPQYGGAAAGRRLGLDRQFLHAAKLTFRHPRSGQTVSCESNLPADLRHASDAAVRERVSEGPDGGST
jgi:23S rRNA pseudouridine1911/1915/1917 synthase